MPIMASIALLLCSLSFTRCQFDDIDTINDIGRHWPQLGWGIMNSACVEFPGITCSENGTHVSQLNLSNKQLAGSIPPQLGNFTKLTILDLTTNRLTGSIPPQLANFPNLKVLTVNTPPVGCRTDWPANKCSLASISSCLVPPPYLGTPPQPSDSFECVEGIWTANTSFVAPDFDVSGPTVIQGNLTINNTITFYGLESNLEVSGCIVFPGNAIVLNLSEEDIEELSKNESNRRKQILQNSSCTNDLSSTSLRSNAPKSCKSVSTSNSDKSTRSSLTMAFLVDSSGCRIWWIILASVLGGIISIVIILVLLVTFNDRMKAKVRPFWVRSHKEG